MNRFGQRSVTEFNYRYADETSACVFAGVEVSGGGDERAIIVEALQAKGFGVLDMTHNDTARLHLRHMIGGHAKLSNERLFRFRFPERPGALMDFLNRMGDRCNITLFHYRNHGSAYGRVLVGFQWPDEQQQQLSEFITELGFPAEEESLNGAYDLFLR